jgi:transposase
VVTQLGIPIDSLNYLLSTLVRDYFHISNYLKKELMVKKDFLDLIPNRAGADMGSDLVFIHIAGLRVKSFQTHTRGLKECIDYMLSHNVESVAVEATGVYWLNFFDLCHESNLDAWLINPKYTKTRAEKKTDVQDAIWIQRLHSADFLEKSFMPNNEVRALREYVRTRENYISERARKVNQMNKALIQMNIRIDNVISQIHGVSGMKMINAILAGERNAEKLIEMCDVRIKSKKSEALRDALQGNYQPQYLFTLKMALEDYTYLDQKIKNCDSYIEKQLIEMCKDLQEPEQINKPKAIRHNKPKIDNLQMIMQTLTGGVDLTTIPGITNYSLLRLTSELGNNVDAWPSHKHFTSFLNLSPRQNQSGKSNKRPKSNRASHRAGQIFRELAQSVMNSKHQSLGLFGRRLKSKKGPQIAIKALARKIAKMYYICSKRQMEYIEPGIDTYTEKNKIRTINRLRSQAAKLGFQLEEVKVA